jgi:hypothetical protein
MTRLRTCLRDYLKMRRSLGFKLYDAGIGLLRVHGAQARPSYHDEACS